ncbi:MAG: glucose 1-dehydrogenase [Alphaproteobacteria bacterium]|jgi:2-dehydro-3-deoxy-D-gluconate 5-dehydrogenase|nr:glucose 1-dehydrogenase [Alphaproteobacteria bacterium]MBT4019468.1 glucose 1-dehydrogenase [Alphaproteobacteria bacterium]MBT4967290.1 glucose 1-dehydrogenase [Alphaproteobacteria bacterium]MBT5160467.1 glucose 1-dehydrogenase [Alphaproteobacteria bacterium]MBT5919486.1 glucose 1-dehydrogenase [Alphaproteobacteria bacterium]
MKLFDLTGKVAIITGGNRGLGLGMAEGIARAGANIVVAARDEKKSREAVDHLTSLGVEAQFIAVDVVDEASCHAMVESAEKRFGRVDILVNNAGINDRKPPQDYSLSEWRKIIDTNLNSVFVCCQAIYPAFQRAGGGKIINIGSMLSIFGASFAVPYGTSKGGVVQMTKGLASAWAADNIQVNAILPGWVDTDLTRNARKQVDGLHDKIIERTPQNRWGTPDDFQGIAVFLASSGSDFLTGTAIPVDGGFSIQI